MTDDNYFPLRKFFNEGLLKDLALFSLIFLLVLSQEGQDLLLIVFPLVTFIISLFFRFVGTNKTKLGQSSEIKITYRPLGSELQNANRLFYCTMIQLILLFWIGAESLYRPQLLEPFSLVFMGVYIFAYSFGFYWIFIDLWKCANITLYTKNAIRTNQETSLKEKGSEVKIFLKTLKVKMFRFMTLGTLLIFCFLNLLNLVFILISIGGNSLGLKISLPGTTAGISSSLIVPYSAIVCLIVSPLVTTIVLISIYKDISAISDDKLNEIISPFPELIQEEIRQKLQSIQNKSRDLDI